MLKQVLKERDLLPILQHEDGTPVTPETWEKRREELLNALATYSYGFSDNRPVSVRGELVKEQRDYANKVSHEKIDLTVTTDLGDFTFPIWIFRPKNVEKPPVLLHIAFFRGAIATEAPIYRVPVEEITDRGYALVSVRYTDMLSESHYGRFIDGFATYFGVTKENRKPDTWGRIGMWAYGASRIMDYLETREDLDYKHTALIGHSRLGKTALWASAQDERFWCTISNDSGYGGAATSKGGTPESEKARDFADDRNAVWDWFCNNFMNYVDKENEKPYDQSWLLACIAPRLLYVGSAAEDFWADPTSEFVSTLWASQAWELLGKTGLVTPDKLPEAGDVCADGNVGYHMRPGTHFLSREDWNNYMNFLDRHLGKA